MTNGKLDYIKCILSVIFHETFDDRSNFLRLTQFVLNYKHDRTHVFFFLLSLYRLNV